MSFRIPLFILVFVAFSGQSVAQVNPIVPDIDTTNLVNPTDLIIAYEETSQLIRDVSRSMINDYRTSEIEKEYYSLKDKIDNYIRIGDNSTSNMSISRIDDLVIIFERLISDVQGWQETLMGFSTELSNYKIEIIKSKMRMSVDVDNLTEGGKEYYNERFVPVFDQSDSLEALIDERLGDVLELEYYISQDYIQLVNRTEELKGDRRDYWKRILAQRDYLWSRSDSLMVSVTGTSNSKFKDTIWRIKDFFPENPGATILLILLVAGFFMMLKSIRKKDVEEHAEEDRQPQLYIYPVAQALLFGGILFPLIYPPTTTLMYDFALLVSYVPFLLILREVLERKLFRRYLIFFIFFLGMKMGILLLGYKTLANWIITVSAVMFIITLVGPSLRNTLKTRFKYTLLLNWLLRIILGAGIIIMISGRPALARIFINGAAETIAIALMLIYYANWMDQLIDFIKKRPYTQRLGNNKAELYEYFEKFRTRMYFLLFFLFIVAFLRDFNLLASVKESLTEFFVSERHIGQLVFTMGGIALFFVVIFVSTKLSSTIKFLTEDKSYFKSQKRTANLSVMVRFFLVTGGFMLALLVSGIPLDQITIILGALSVGIGFGLQNIVNNLISGLILIFERPIQSGDLVELQTYTGVVKDISIRSSVIRTYDGAEVIVPNGNLISQEVINWTLSNQHRRIEIHVGVAYGSDTEKVTEVLKEPILAHEKVLKLPQPLILFNGFGDSSLNFRLLFWTADIDNWLRTQSEVTHAVYQTLNDNGFEIPFPQRDLHIRSWDKKAGPPNSSNKEKPSTKSGKEKE